MNSKLFLVAVVLLASFGFSYTKNVDKFRKHGHEHELKHEHSHGIKSCPESKPKVVSCYWGSWSYYRTSIAKFTTANIDPSLCTHVYYAFIGLNNATQEVEILDTWLDETLGNMKNFTALKTEYNETKFMVAIGGWNQGSYAYSVVASNATLRARFIEQVLEIIQEYGFDGLDFDWEYPTQRDSAYGSADKENFVLLLQEIKAAFEPLGLLLTAAVGTNSDLINVAYDVVAISDVLDFVNFMTYDIHVSSENITNINAPLYDPNEPLFNANAFVQAWIKAGADPQKLIFGIPSYGTSWTLADASDNGVRAPANSSGTAGEYTASSGTLAYYEILQNLQNGWTRVYNKAYPSPYAYSGNQWVSFDDPESIAAKVEYACSLKLGGIMTWAIDFDDFSGQFGEKYPLLNAMNQIRNC